jgi:transglutaminase-like putative cysteine protease
MTSSESGIRGRRGGAFVTVVAVVIWLTLLGILVKDRYFSRESLDSDAIRIKAVESDDWFVIRIRGAYSGFGRSRQYREGGDWIVRDELNLSLNIQGRVKPVRIVNESRVDERFRLISFTLKVSSGIISFEQKGHMEGRDLVLEPARTKGGGAKRIKLYKSPRISRSLGLPLPLTGLKVGDRFLLPVFDPLDGRKWDAEIQVLEQADLQIAGRRVAAWRVRALFRAMALTIWIDKDGRLLKGYLPLRITVVRSDKNEIRRLLRSDVELPEMTAMSAVPVEGRIPDPRGLKVLKLKVERGADLQIPRYSDRQTYVDSVLTIRKEKPPKANYSLPYKGETMERYLAASRFIAADAPTIVAKARAIVGDEKDPVRAARLINEWVAGFLKKVPTPSVPDAVTILRTKQGDCNEHAVLAASLARAVGLPARIALGLVRMGDGFYYHAWVQYWDGKRWFTGDPLMNQLPADPTHVTLLVGDVDKHLNVLTFLGKLKFRVIEAR